MLASVAAVWNSLRRLGMYTPFKNTAEQIESRRRAVVLGSVAGAAAAGFGVLASAATRRDTATVDERVRKQTAAPAQHPTRRAAEAVAPLGKWWAYLPAVLAACIYLLTAPRTRRSRPRSSRRVAGAGAMLLSGATTAALGPVFDRWLPQPPAPPGHSSRRKPVFPSGHTFGPTAVSLTTAYVLSREGLARSEIAAPVALMVPLVTASGKILAQRHWASDVLGGYLGGTAVAAAWLSAYEAARASGNTPG